MRDFVRELRSLADGLSATGPVWCGDDVVMLRELADGIELGVVGLEGCLVGVGYSPAFLRAVRDLVGRDVNGGCWADDCVRRDGIPVSFWDVAGEMCLSTEDDRFCSDWVWVVESDVRRRAARALAFLLGGPRKPVPPKIVIVRDGEVPSSSDYEP
jgi:hypothetical protein